MRHASFFFHDPGFELSLLPVSLPAMACFAVRVRDPATQVFAIHASRQRRTSTSSPTRTLPSFRGRRFLTEHHGTVDPPIGLEGLDGFAALVALSRCPDRHGRQDTSRTRPGHVELRFPDANSGPSRPRQRPCRPSRRGSAGSAASTTGLASRSLRSSSEASEIRSSGRAVSEADLVVESGARVTDGAMLMSGHVDESAVHSHEAREPAIDTRGRRVVHQACRGETRTRHSRAPSNSRGNSSASWPRRSRRDTRHRSRSRRSMPCAAARAVGDETSPWRRRACNLRSRASPRGSTTALGSEMPAAGLDRIRSGYR